MSGNANMSEGVLRALARSADVAHRSEQRQNEWFAKQDEGKEYRRNTFSLAGEGMFFGYHNPDETWNGFECPFFPLSEVERIAVLVDDMNSTDEPCSVIVRGDSVIVRTSEYVGFCEPLREHDEEVPTVVVDGVTLYGVGSWSWCWEVR